MTWETVPLGDVIELRYGKALKAENRSGSGFPVIGSGGVAGAHDSALVTTPTIVVGRKGSIGSLTYAPDGCWPIDTAYFTHPKRDVDLRWLFWTMQSLGLETMNKSAAVPGLNRDDAYRARVPLPPLPEQRRIAAILDEADALSRTAVSAVADVTSVVDAAFRVLESTLEPGRVTALSEIASVGSGITKGRKLPTGELIDVPYMTVANVQDKRLDFSSIKTISVSAMELDRYRLHDQDLLLTEGGDPDKLGRGVVWREELPMSIHQNHVFRVRPLDKATDMTWLNWEVGSDYGKRYFLRAAKQTTGIATINSTQLKQFPARVPSDAARREFRSILDHTETLRSTYEARSHALDTLFASLQHRAFRGEL